MKLFKHKIITFLKRTNWPLGCPGETFSGVLKPLINRHIGRSPFITSTNLHRPTNTLLHSAPHWILAELPFLTKTSFKTQTSEVAVSWGCVKTYFCSRSTISLIIMEINGKTQNKFKSWKIENWSIFFSSKIIFFLAIFTVKLILLSLIGEKTGAATFVLSEQILPKRNVRKR